MTVGNTHTHSIEDILKGEPFERVREAHRTGEIDDLPCGECDQLNEYEESPLLYSTRDKDREIGKTSITKFKLGEN
jgi:hypothetical protein